MRHSDVAYVTEWFPAHEDLETAFDRFVCVVLHLSLNYEYRKAGLPTDSPRKILSSITFDNMVFPRWCFDLAREIARPMVNENIVFLPWIDANFACNAPVPVAGFGLTPGSFYAIDVFCRSHGLDARPFAPEELVPSPIFFCDGEFKIGHEMTSMRRNASRILCTLVNGCIVVERNDVTFRKRPNEAEPLLVRRERSEDWDGNLVPVVYTPGRVRMPAGQVGNIALSIINGAPHIHEGIRRWWFYVAETDAARSEAYSNAWVRQSSFSTGVPPPLFRYLGVPFGVDYGLRFPTDGTHSRTPPPDPAQERMAPRPPGQGRRKRKRQQRDEEVEEPPGPVND